MDKDSCINTVEVDNYEDSNDLIDIDSSGIVVYARDWTIETIYNQIELGNIDLNPKFQRRNAWQDERRSKLIESIIMGYPIPEIVLAEDPLRKRAFIVIDGKQRLLSIAGFINHEKFDYWKNPKLQKLNVCKELNGKTIADLSPSSRREFDNSSLRCTVITNFRDSQVLYDIFYRLNSGSVALSTQELRQVLNRGPFGDFLLEATSNLQPIHRVMGIEQPDMRLRDVEIVLRIMSFCLYPKDYRGNLKFFLDEKMGYITKNWELLQNDINNLYKKINNTIDLLEGVFPDKTNVGRKYKNNNFEKRFNKVLFEVEIFYFLHLDNSILSKKTDFISAFKVLCNDTQFLNSIESSTKNIENYRIRYGCFETLINNVFHLDLSLNPFK